MKLSEIEVGCEYALAVGKRSGFSRAVVIDVDGFYENWRDWNSYSSDPNARPREVRRIDPYPNAGNARRFLVAIAIAVTRPLRADPETGSPWQDHNDRAHGLHYLVDWAWIPYAARSADIRARWDPTLHGPQYLRTYDEAVALGRAHDANIAAQQERNRIRNEEVDANRARAQKVLAANREFYETRVEPALIEAGLDPAEFAWDGRGERDKVQIDPDALIRMIERMSS